MSKYNNKKTIIDNITFDSKKEANYYLKLKEEKSKHLIKDFQLQVPFELQPKFKYNNETIRGIKYICDFLITNNDDTQIIIDVKGMETDVFKIKKKMLLYKYPNIDFRII